LFFVIPLGGIRSKSAERLSGLVMPEVAGLLLAFGFPGMQPADPPGSATYECALLTLRARKGRHVGEDASSR